MGIRRSDTAAERGFGNCCQILDEHRILAARYDNRGMEARVRKRGTGFDQGCDDHTGGRGHAIVLEHEKKGILSAADRIEVFNEIALLCQSEFP